MADGMMSDESLEKLLVEACVALGWSTRYHVFCHNMKSELVKTEVVLKPEHLPKFRYYKKSDYFVRKDKAGEADFQLNVFLKRNLMTMIFSVKVGGADVTEPYHSLAHLSRVHEGLPAYDPKYPRLPVPTQDALSATLDYGLADYEALKKEVIRRLESGSPT